MLGENARFFDIFGVLHCIYTDKYIVCFVDNWCKFM